MISDSFARAVGVPVKAASQMPRQADGITPLDVVGEVHCEVTRGTNTFSLDALVVKRLDVDVLAGNPFLSANDIAVRPAKHQIIIQGAEVVQYGAQHSQSASIRRTQAYLLRAPPKQTVIMPGDYVELKTPIESEADALWALEPRADCPSNQPDKVLHMWPAVQEIQSIDHVLRVPNTTPEPIILRRGEHFCQFRPVTTDIDVSAQTSLPSSPHGAIHQQPSTPYSAHVSMDPDCCLSPEMREKFVALHLELDEVFNPKVSKYNGVSGDIKAIVNMGPTLPPPEEGSSAII